MPDITGWFLENSMRTTDTQARGAARNATALIQRALAQPAPNETQAALAAVHAAARGGLAAATATQKYIAHQQQAAQGGLPATLEASAAQAVAAMAAVAAQTESDGRARAADPTGQVGWAQLQRAPSVVTAIENALAQAERAVQDTQSAKTVWESARQQAQQAAQARQAALAPYGGIDPADVMDQLKNGRYPNVPAGIMLHKNEIALCALATALAEDRTTRRNVGGYSGFSVPVAYGIRFRVGSYQGHSIAHEQLTRVDQGTVIVTTQRIVFNGSKRTISIALAKVLNTVLYRDGVDVRAENRAKREVFELNQPNLLNTYILIACQLL